MSEKRSFLSAGVFKVDKKFAGYKDLYAVAQERKKDENFYELIIRNVSEDNYGIQFVYYEDEYSEDKIAKIYKKQLEQLYGKGLYAWDVASSNGPVNDTLVVLKSLSV